MDAQAITGQEDEFQRLIANAKFALVLLINESTGAWELTEPASARTCAERGLIVGGVLAMVGGYPKAAISVLLDEATNTAIAEEFGRRYKRSHVRWHCEPAPGAH